MKNLINRHFSKIMQTVIYTFFACMTVYHLFTDCNSVLSSVLYFTITNSFTFSLALLLATRDRATELSKQAIDSLYLYLAYVTIFTCFFIVVGAFSDNLKEYLTITGNCIGAAFYFSILLIIAISKIIINGLRK